MVVVMLRRTVVSLRGGQWEGLSTLSTFAVQSIFSIVYSEGRPWVVTWSSKDFSGRSAYFYILSKEGASSSSEGPGWGPFSTLVPIFLTTRPLVFFLYAECFAFSGISCFFVFSTMDGYSNSFSPLSSAAVASVFLCI